jgi:hypothetical protein
MKNKKSAFELFKNFELKLKKHGFTNVEFNFKLERNNGSCYYDTHRIVSDYEIKFREEVYVKKNNL